MIVQLNKIKKCVKYVFITFILCIISPIHSIAANKEADPLGFVVQAIRPDTQIETNKSYFFIETQPDETQTLKVKVKSTQKDPIKIQAFIANGTTGSTGNIEYDESTKDLDKSLKHPLTEMVKINEPEITLENFEEKVVELSVTPPKESYEGIKLGAVVFQTVEDKEQTKTQTISSKYQYKIGLITTETGEEYENAKNLELASAKLGLKLGRKQVAAVIHNPESKIADNLKIEATVTKKGSDTVLKKQTVENARMAPNSTYEFSVDWGVDVIESGDYTLKVHAQNDEEDWKWQKDFSVSAEKAKKMNEETVFKVESPDWLPYVVILAIGSLVLVIVILTARNKRWKKMVYERAKRRKSKQAKRKKSEQKKVKKNKQMKE
ncbi:hypothetical protein UAW_02993 [Enterococcus haemoperoxidus ATCC BAA-382]|uniref:Uncharacterized protein n=1 Tax=Enterococcus haemoperoxidus ATCC BAA-382 TaxID=1158608 RepID=R2SI98_9ENTE|nr:DUF916 and DUF3324 domain-containing protein [Enterococcus haemoperoxidus]EOH92596.1 hypothetical protein UAW_02993 [Enterococcus haemoperoxidus ATCC BAA-382]EOT61695.1 hypothetical protein I583_00677 [Enterococcus haemoperoxidus ATCC BAA-382]OJG55531.1 hypothetical protein RV06_GL001974 [Enterococcus haemoperoxidus]